MLLIRLGITHLRFMGICGYGSSSIIYKFINIRNRKFYIVKEEKQKRNQKKFYDSIDIGLHANIRKYAFIGRSEKSIFRYKSDSKYVYHYYLSDFYIRTLRDFILNRNNIYYSSTNNLSNFSFSKENENSQIEYGSYKELILNIMIDIVKGVVYLHRKNKVHCDLKPENIFIKSENHLVPEIGDFGLTRDVNVGIMRSGTYTYKLPGSYMDESVFKTDIWALGLIYFELLWPMKTQMERIKEFEFIRKHKRVNNEFIKIFKDESKIIEGCWNRSEEGIHTASILLKRLIYLNKSL